MIRRGITMIEMLVVVVCMAIIIGACVSLATTAIKHTATLKTGRVVYDHNAIFEDRLRSILEQAYLSPNTTDTAAYFRGGTDLAQTVTGQDQDPTTLVFTAISPKVPTDILESTNQDFETLNQQYGPQGGITEYGIGMTPVGNSTADGGLLLRQQTPADGDSSQGGYQSVFDADIDTISYEFYDGANWDTTWDTTTSTTPRLPAAVRITYRRKNDSVDHQFVVRLINSDVTPANPVVTQ